MIGFCSDGATVMLGSSNRVAKLFSYNLLWLFVSHLIAYRLALIGKEAFHRIPEFQAFEGLVIFF